MKKHRIGVWISISLFVFFLIAVASCGTATDDGGPEGQADIADEANNQDKVDQNPALEDYIEEGRWWLTVGEAGLAREAFEMALAEDSASAEAHYGAMLSSSLQLWEFVSALSVMITTFNSGGHDNLEKAEVDPNRELIQLIVQQLQTGLFSLAGEKAREHAQWLDQYGDYDFVIWRVPVLMQLRLAATMSGEFDSGEKEGCRFLGNIFDGVAKTAVSLNLDFNLDYLLNLSFDGLDTEETISRIVDLIDRLLNDPAYPNMLQIDPASMDDVAEARINMGQGFYAFHQAFEEIRSETDSQINDVVAYLDLGGNNAWDAGDPILFPGSMILEEDEYELLGGLEGLFADLGAAFLDGTDEDLFSDQDNPFHLNTLNPILNALGLPSLIPGFVTLDIAAFYEDLEPDTIRDFLQTIVDLLQLFLPEPPAFP